MTSRLRVLVLIPIAAALALFVAAKASSNPDQVYLFAGLVAKALAVVGAILAASRFARGDHLWSAWSMLGVSYGLLVVKDAVWGYDTLIEASTLSVPQETIRSTVLLVANVASVAGMLQFARAWNVAGLAPSESTARRNAVIAGALVTALLIAGKGAWTDAHHMDHGAWGNVCGDVADILSFVLLAPVLLTAIALRGGLLAWPWALLTASNVGWLVFDATSTLADLFGAHVHLFSELVRVAACALVLAAGAAQRRITSS